MISRFPPTEMKHIYKLLQMKTEDVILCCQNGHTTHFRGLLKVSTERLDSDEW
jgi:hypothetical protein